MKRTSTSSVKYTIDGFYEIEIEFESGFVTTAWLWDVSDERNLVLTVDADQHDELRDRCLHIANLFTKIAGEIPA